MRTACPACGATYEVPDHLIGAGRHLRCAKCGHDWLVRPPGAEETAGTAPPAPPAEAVPPPAPAQEAQDLSPSHPVLRRPPQVIDPPLPQLGDSVPERPRIGLWLGWIISILVLLLLAAGLLLFRSDIVAAWPPMARLYTALGLEPGRQGPDQGGAASAFSTSPAR